MLAPQKGWVRKMHELEMFERYESDVRGYVRSFPVLLDKASGSTLSAEDGREYLDFFSGAGALNYGHNNPAILQPMIAYLQQGRILHGLDMATAAKRDFIDAFTRLVLTPRGLDYKIQFTGPTGANAVEAALKVARQATGRSNVVAFTNSFHGLSLGALAATSNARYRAAAGALLPEVTRIPFDGYLGEGVDTLQLFERMLDDPGSGLDLPAAVIVETVQGEGGINVASAEWLRRLRAITETHGILLIVDDIQAGVGRTGSFFSFEPAGIVPDIVTMSKSISGSGQPMSLVLLRKEVDVWKPGAHTGTFRGNNLAFVGARAALEHYWSDMAFQESIRVRSDELSAKLHLIVSEFPEAEFTVRGRGLMLGLASTKRPDLAGLVSRETFKNGVIIETSGAVDEVIKFLPALTISAEQLGRGVETVRRAIRSVMAHG